MKKLLETSLGNWDDTFFSQDGRRVPDEQALELIKTECNPYNTKDEGGVLVYMPTAEFLAYQKAIQSNAPADPETH